MMSYFYACPTNMIHSSLFCSCFGLFLVYFEANSSNSALTLGLGAQFSGPNLCRGLHRHAVRQYRGLVPRLMALMSSLSARQMLLEARADVNVAREDGVSASYMAVQNGSGQELRLLLEARADLAKVTAKGAAPLHLAVQQGKVETIELLLEHRADPNLETAQGQRPLQLAKGVEVARVLEEAGAEAPKAQPKAKSKGKAKAKASFASASASATGHWHNWSCSPCSAVKSSISFSFCMLLLLSLFYELRGAETGLQGPNK